MMVVDNIHVFLVGLLESLLMCEQRVILLVSTKARMTAWGQPPDVVIRVSDG